MVGLTHTKQLLNLLCIVYIEKSCLTALIAQTYEIFIKMRENVWDYIFFQSLSIHLPGPMIILQQNVKVNFIFKAPKPCTMQ